MTGTITLQLNQITVRNLNEGQFRLNSFLSLLDQKNFLYLPLTLGRILVEE